MMREDTLQPAPGQPGQRELGLRLLLLKLFLALFFVTLAIRLVNIQILEAGKYQALARKQYEQKFTLPATRGNVYDRNGNVLISNTTFLSFAADPRIIADKAGDVAASFSQIFGRPTSMYLEKLQDDSRRFVWLERRVKPEIARKVEEAALDGIVVMNEAKRLYHYDDLAGSLLGFTDIDNKGIAGLELQLDDELSGKNGFVIMQRDGLGRVRPSADYPRVEPVNGHNVTLTVDLAYQAIVEEELKRGVAANSADGGLAVMMNPKTGEILAMAAVPSVNPNEFHGTDPATARNRVVTDVFEPGSVFKVVTASAAYEYKILNPETKYYAEHGQMKVQIAPGGLAGSRFRTIKDTHEYDWLTFQEAIEVSSNIVMAKVSKLIGPERLYREARDFGFGILTGIDVPGEVRGRLKKPMEWSKTTLQTMSYGYEVGVTPLQMVCAYAAVANGGILMKPFVVAQIRSSNGEVLHEQHPQKTRQVVSEETAKLLTQAFEGTVERGTAKDVSIAGIRIAGKTGTSRKVLDGRYSDNNYTASFVGYFPAEDPQIVCLVMLDNPRARGYYGGITSGPVFRAIAQRILNTSARFSRAVITLRDPQSGEVSIPDVRTLHWSLARKILETNGLKSQFYGKGDVVIRQSPEPGKKVERGDLVALVLNDLTSVRRNGQVGVPDVRGMSVRRAMNRLAIEEFEVKVQGSGIVVVQSPAPDKKVKPGTTVVLVCEPKTVMSVSLY